MASGGTMDEAEYLLQHLSHIMYTVPLSKQWTVALPHIKRFAINPLRPHLARVTWVTRTQALARRVVDSSFSFTYEDELTGFSVELGEIGLEEGYQAPAGGCRYISYWMRGLQGYQKGGMQDIDMIIRSMDAFNTDGSSLRFTKRSQLKRATSLLSKMYMAFRTATFERNILHAEERHGILYFVEDNNTFDYSTGQFLFRSLPKEVIEDSKMSAPLLMYLECGQSIVDMTTQIEILVSNLCSDIEEVNIMVKNARRPTCCRYYSGIHGNNMISRHTVLRVTTHDGQLWAIDLTAAQFGWTETLVLWDIYVAQRVRTIIDVKPFGDYDQARKKIAALNSTFGITQEAQTKMTDCFNDIVSDWLKRERVTPAQLMDLSDHDYSLKEPHLMTAIRDGLQASVEDLRQRGLYRYYLNSVPGMNDNKLSLTRSRREYKREKKSWCSEQKYQKNLEQTCRLKGVKFGLAGMIKPW